MDTEIRYQMAVSRMREREQEAAVERLAGSLRVVPDRTGSFASSVRSIGAGLWSVVRMSGRVAAPIAFVLRHLAPTTPR
jgi:hypothetical protein